MWVATLEVDLLLGDVHSLKEKRAIVRPLVADLRRTFSCAVAETGDADLHRRAAIGVAVVGGENAHLIEVVDKIEDYLARRPEVELLSAHRTFVNTDD